MKSRRPPKEPAANSAIAEAGLYGLILLRDVIGIGISGHESQLTEPRPPARELTEAEIQALQAVNDMVSAALGKPSPKVEQPGDPYGRHWKNVCEALNLQNVDTTCTRASPRLLRMLYLEVLTKHSRPWPPALTLSLLYVCAEALYRHDAGEIQKITARDRDEIVGGLAKNFIDRGQQKNPAYREAERLLGLPKSETTRTRYRRHTGKLK